MDSVDGRLVGMSPRVSDEVGIRDLARVVGLDPQDDRNIRRLGSLLRSWGISPGKGHPHRWESARHPEFLELVEAFRDTQAAKTPPWVA